MARRTRPSDHPPRRIGLVLGAGGVVGASWLAGGLAALEAETGWNPAGAERIVGTSAGSMIGSMLAAGSPPWRAAAADGPSDDRLADSARRPGGRDRSAGAGFSIHRGLPRIGPASPYMAVSALTRLSAQWPAQLMAGLMPEGIVSTDDVERAVRGVVPSGWGGHPGLRVVACDYENGDRVAFGDPDAPRADVADAVAASCAIPSFYKPKTIDGRRYVDGVLYSASNLDLLEREGLDLIICLNPTSSLHTARTGSLQDLTAAVLRSYSGRRLGHEARRVRAAGTDVVLIQPTGDDLAVMPPNLMSRERRREVYETAVETVGAQLREAGVDERLAGAAKGLPPVRRAAPA
ncbi:MAG: patatin-like phospholipase family protein [Acidimicrobiales bacterium]